MFARIVQAFSGRFQAQLLIILVLGSIIPVAAVGGYATYSSTRALSASAISREKTVVQTEADAIEKFLSGVNNDVTFIGKLPPVQGLIRARANGGVDPQGNTTTREWAQRLQTVFAALIESNPQYNQVRFIDENGNELVRVDGDGSSVKVIPATNLQNKSSSAYFTETNKLAAGDVYVSPVQLNREGGVIQEPFNPTIRFATPVFDAAGNRRGLMIINVFAADFIKLADAINTESTTSALIDRDGYYLSHPDPAKEWGFELDREVTLASDFSPALQEKILAGGTEANVTEGKNSLIAFARIYTDPKEQQAIYAVTIKPKSEIFASLNTFKGLALLIAIGSLAIIIPLGFIGIAKAGKLVNQIKKLVGGVTQSSANIFSVLEKQEQSASEQASSVNETTATMEELGETSLQSARQAEASATKAREAIALAGQGMEAVQNTRQEISGLKDKVGSIAEQIVQLSEQTGQIANITELVTDFASQTNMLALNAAVVAARAGAQGRSFAVVAGEIQAAGGRKLADQSGQSASKINSLVGEIQASINNTVMVTDEGSKAAILGLKLAEDTTEAFNSISTAIDEVALNTQQIALSSKQQAVAVQQVVSAMSGINLGAQETAAGATQVKAATQELTSAARELSAAV